MEARAKVVIHNQELSKLFDSSYTCMPEVKLNVDMEQT